MICLPIVSPSCREKWSFTFPVRNMGEQPAGVCDFDQTKYQKRKEIRVGTRAGSIAIYCANEAILNAGLT